MSGAERPDIETTAPPAVSSLRSRFEKLAIETGPSVVKRGVGSQSLLTPESPRPRALSSSLDPQPSPPSRNLRSSASSSDLNSAAAKRPPPPPPIKPSPVPTPSPLLRPVPIPLPVSSPDVPLASELVHKPPPPPPLTRKPPPPPPPLHQERSDPATSVRTAGVASLVQKFGNTQSLDQTSTKPSLAPNRIFSHSPHNVSSLSAHSPSSSDVSDSDRTAAADPPPLPIRRSGVQGLSHERGQSTDSVLSSSSCSSQASSEVDAVFEDPPISIITTPPPHPSRASLVPPPRPPPRMKTLLSPASHPSSGSASASSSVSSLSPPPLPARRGVDQARTMPPRHQSMFEPATEPLLQQMIPPAANHISPPPERKAFGAHPPPPTRIIGLGDKLPPPRRAPDASSSEEEEEEDPKIKVELLPDSSRSSRRPPVLNGHKYSESHIHVPAHHSVTAVSGHIVAVAAYHRVKVFDLDKSDQPVFDLDGKDVGLEAKAKELKVTSMEFRPAMREADRGSYLWIGTKDGHLLELDIRNGSATGMKLAVHSHTVTHIFRHGHSMVTVDETGKVLVFSPDEQGDDVRLAFTTPRVMRIAEKQNFAKMLGGWLWTSARETNGSGNASGTSRGPMVRVYDVFTPSSTGKSLLPTDHLGAVTSGTILPSDPQHVYIGHEGGHISIWDIDTEDGIPQYKEVIKVSPSDVLSLEGINDRLWAGGRKGMIAAYDVVPRPWVMTNRWMAHQELPVHRIVADSWSIEKTGRLSVYSIGRDDRLSFWDGLLGIDWIDQELLKCETEFSTFRELTVLMVSWNIDSVRPDALVGAAQNVNFLHDVLTSVDSPDIISVGFQEVIDLESRRMTAKNMLYGSKAKTADGSISQKVTTAYKKWFDCLIHAVRLAMPPESPYTAIHMENMVGLMSCIFVKDTERNSLKQTATANVKRGLGGRYGNKGSIVTRLVIEDTSICFVNSHLAAGQHHIRQRNADIAAVLDNATLLPGLDAMEEPLAYVNGGNGSMVLDHEIVFMSGDMNYRIDQRREPVIAAIRGGEFQPLLIHDQLHKEMKFNRGFRLRDFIEGPITFPPTYKYDPMSSEYDTSEKKRVPAWCDRIMWRSRDPSRVQQLHYQRWEANLSDHRPISSAFRLTIKSVNQEVRAKVKSRMEQAWREQEKKLLSLAHHFYVEQAMA